MTDVHNPDVRSKNMRAIRGKNTAPEMEVRRQLHAAGFRFRLHSKELPGRPDVVLPKHRVALFVHGCFWHQHPGCRFATMPAKNREFWFEKLSMNAMRDERQQRALTEAGWTPLVIWECQIRDALQMSRLFETIRLNAPVR